MKRIAGLILVMVLVFSLSSALAQRISCPDGGFTVTLPDHFVEESTGGDPELCFYWHGSKLTVQGYVSYLGEVAGSDLFEVLTGDEQESGSKTINGMNMIYSLTQYGSDITVMYSWMDRGNNVTLYFQYSSENSSVRSTVKSIMNSISFDAGH